MQESFDWVKPSPFWIKNGDDLDQGSFFRPAVLEYASDDFVEEFLADTGAVHRGSVGGARGFCGKGFAAKLYQPAHGRFYLVCATLSCRQPGLPDRAIRLAEGESVFYVLRRVQGSTSMPGSSTAIHRPWKPIDRASQRRLVDHEERQPMFRAAAGNERGLLYAYRTGHESQRDRRRSDRYPGRRTRRGIRPGDLRLFELENRFWEPA